MVVFYQLLGNPGEKIISVIFLFKYTVIVNLCELNYDSSLHRMSNFGNFLGTTNQSVEAEGIIEWPRSFSATLFS